MKQINLPTRFLLNLIILIAIMKIGIAQTKLSSIEGAYMEKNNIICESGDLDCQGERMQAFTFCPLAQTNLVDGDVIVFEIPGLNDFIDERKLILSNVRLMIDGLELSGLDAYLENSETDLLRFRLSLYRLTEEDKIALFKLPGKSIKKVIIGVKLDESNLLYYNQSVCMYLQEVDRLGTFGWLLISIFTGIFLSLILVNNSILRDGLYSTGIENNEILNNSSTYIGCFSFSKTQMAYWSMIVIGCFIYIWAFTGDYNSMNPTALVLLGIATVTITTSNLIVKSENKRAEKNLIKQEQLRNYRGKNPNESNFIEDILSDGDGISLHRVQALIFNLIFGIIFIKSVIIDYTMPEFNETHFILLGLSNGTYAFLKNQENK